MTQKYQSNPLHRNGDPYKSQWNQNKISVLKEEQIWKSFFSGTGSQCYGLYITRNNKPDYLGFPAKKSPSALNELFIAKYRSDPSGNDILWHGYPADTTLNIHDRPPEECLIDWEKKNFISSAQMSKILKGKKCSL